MVSDKRGSIGWNGIPPDVRGVETAATKMFAALADLWRQAEVLVSASRQTGPKCASHLTVMLSASETSPCEALNGAAGAWCVVRSVGLRPMRFARGPFADAQRDGR